MTQQRTWSDVFKEIEPDFNEIANLHKAVRFKEECQFALQAVNKNGKLSGCDVQTIQDSIKNVAAIGLTLNPAHGYAYLVPDTIRVNDNWISVCRLSISFKGLMKLSTDCGAVEWIQAETVRETDKFTFNGHGIKPTHSFNPFAKDRGQLVGVYCVAKLPNGDYLTDMMPWSEVALIRSKAKIKAVWDSWAEEMAKKAVIKRASKQWPNTNQFERLAAGVQILNDGEGSREETYTVEQKKKYDQYLHEGTNIEFAALVQKYQEQDELVIEGLYNSFPKGEITVNKARHNKKLMDGIREIASRAHDLASDDEETKELALENLNDREKSIINRKAVA